jgi:hypothetical protein
MKRAQFSIIILLTIQVHNRAFASSGNVGIEKNQSLTTDATNKRANDWAFFNFETAQIKKNNDYFAATDFRILVGPGALQYSVPEAYISHTGANSGTNTSLGRRLVKWNPDEAFWGLGQINASQGFDLLESKQEGLVGVHFNSDYVDLFWSPIFVPAMNPAIEVKDGEVKSNTPWVKLPPRNTVLKGQEIPIYYSLNRPTNSKIVNQHSIGGRVGPKWETGQLKLMAMYKPENQLRVNASGYYDSKNEMLFVEANPSVNHHSLYGFDYEQKFGGVDFNLGHMIEDPNSQLDQLLNFTNPTNASYKQNRTEFDSEYFDIKPNYKRNAYWHAGSLYRAPVFQLGLNYIHYVDGANNNGDDFYSTTNHWNRAVGMLAGYDFTDRTNLQFNYRYDFMRKDRILKTELGHSLQKTWRLGLGLELIASPMRESFWSDYKSQDVVYSNFSYLF